MGNGPVVREQALARHVVIVSMLKGGIVHMSASTNMREGMLSVFVTWSPHSQLVSLPKGVLKASRNLAIARAFLCWRPCVEATTIVNGAIRIRTFALACMQHVNVYVNKH
mmetsp:Transcript_1827/g.2753  ORF Transcript_1827/g.2753 Transcript_1827/m.2753 type:complete len:110 (+) Transcript_1827:166-495(+)